MAAKRILPWATALLLAAPNAFAQDTGEPETPSAPEETEAPTGTPEVVEAEPTPVAEPEPVEVATPVAEAEPERVVETEIIKVSGGRARVGSAWNRSQEDKEGKNYLWNLDIGGYIRGGYTAIQNDATGTFGAHDGFMLGNARLKIAGEMRSLGFTLSLDGVVDHTDDANDPNAEVEAKLRDAYLFWQPVQAVRLTLGQFKPPYDVEEQASTTDLLFATRSVGSRGVKNIEGRNVSGLSADRQVGVMLGSDHWHFGKAEGEHEGFGISYGLAITNGQSSNRALNDNDKVAMYGRAELHWADLVTLGGAYFMNDRTIGVEPDTLDESVTGWTADLTFTGWGLTFIGSAAGHDISRSDLAGIDPETSGFAYQAQLAYKEPFFGFQPALRYAYFDPTELSGDADALTHLTFGLNYKPDYPVALLLSYTIVGETEEFELPNNRFDSVLQVMW